MAKCKHHIGYLVWVRPTSLLARGRDSTAGRCRNSPKLLPRQVTCHTGSLLHNEIRTFLFLSADKFNYRPMGVASPSQTQSTTNLAGMHARFRPSSHEARHIPGRWQSNLPTITHQTGRVGFLFSPVRPPRPACLPGWMGFIHSPQAARLIATRMFLPCPQVFPPPPHTQGKVKVPKDLSGLPVAAAGSPTAADTTN